MPFGQKGEIKKGEKPFFTGVIQTKNEQGYQTLYTISLWPSEEFKKYMEDLAK